ncbi:unnamed protein product [Adineta steineri]|uniref:Uncharacterized protein n=1 Tax=Adineta steineri TaxID=433720 RepID=A0A819AV58_9BILA|nr:unnamed protein product [Adineta steineri]CAF3790076.1 unnamed protein product [Adineta steineri]
MRKDYTAGGLSDVVSVFGPFLQLGEIAKSRAVAIFRDLKSSSITQQTQPASSHTNTIPSRNPGTSMYNHHIPFDIISQAQKLCPYANSALEHEDITH